MATKKEMLGGGLNALFGGSETNNDEQMPGHMEPEELTDVEEAALEDDLLNSVEDEQLREALRAKRMDGRGRPRKNTDKTGKRTDGYSRTSLILKDEKVAKIKEIAFRETLTMKEIFELALDTIIEKYEAKHGVVVPHPESYKGDINKVFK